MDKNPFDEYFSELGKQREEQVQKEKERQEHTHHLRLKGIQVTKSYHELVMSVLEQLRQTAYPAGMLTHRNPEEQQLPHLGYWSIEVSFGKGLPFYRPTVRVVLELDPNSDPSLFYCELFSDEYTNTVDRQIRAGLSRQELIEALMQLHPLLHSVNSSSKEEQPSPKEENKSWLRKLFGL